MASQPGFVGLADAAAPDRPDAPAGGVGPPPAMARGALAARSVGLVAALVVLAVMCAVSLAVGTRHIGLGGVWSALGHDDGSENAYIVRELRVPRTILGVLVGLGLGLAGTVMQALTRNPLADPGLLGVETGASMAVVLAFFLLGVTTPAGYVWFALAGAAAASLLVYTLGSAGRSATPERMVLAGSAVSAAINSFVAAILLIHGRTFDQYRFWVVGSLAGRGFPLVWQLGPIIVVGAVLALGLGRALNALALGEETGRALG
ncbi:FecCD family ABC transporter permease, partial [Frankia gtarii]|uniref:FecCD family ABC transporter permease n=1 Tax=Frankia gtarii TaxID=2950102 RepID=UPI0021C1EF71